MVRRPHDAEIQWQRYSVLRIAIENYTHKLQSLQSMHGKRSLQYQGTLIWNCLSVELYNANLL